MWGERKLPQGNPRLQVSIALLFKAAKKTIDYTGPYADKKIPPTNQQFVIFA